MPPIPAKVKEGSTIVKYLRYFQKLAEQANLTYVNIVEDIGVGAPALKKVTGTDQKNLEMSSFIPVITML